MRYIRKLRRGLHHYPYLLPPNGDSILRHLWYVTLPKAHPGFIILYYISRLEVFVRTLLGSFHPLSRKYRYLLGTYDQDGFLDQIAPYLLHSTIAHLIRAKMNSLYTTPLCDKLMFQQTCERYQIETVPIIAVISEEIRLLSAQSCPWIELHDFIIKPQSGSQGRGFILFRYDAEQEKYYHIKRNHA